MTENYYLMIMICYMLVPTADLVLHLRCHVYNHVIYDNKY